MLDAFLQALQEACEGISDQLNCEKQQHEEELQRLTGLLRNLQSQLMQILPESPAVHDDARLLEASTPQIHDRRHETP